MGIALGDEHRVTSYYRVILGANHAYATACFASGFIGADCGFSADVQPYLADDRREFYSSFVPIWLIANPGDTPNAAGVACRHLWVVAQGMQTGDIVLSPDGEGSYRAGKVRGTYYFVAERPRHRRAVEWFEHRIPRASLSTALKRAMSSIGTTSDVTQHAAEILGLVER